MGMVGTYKLLPLMTVMLILLACCNGIGSGSEAPASTGGSGEDMAMPPIETRVVRERIIDIPPHLGDMERLEKGQILRFRLFDDADYTARIRSMSRNVQGTVTVTASIEGTTGYMVAATTREVSRITITIPEEDKLYLIQHDPETGSYRVREILSWEAPGPVPDQPIPPKPEGS